MFRTLSICLALTLCIACGRLGAETVQISVMADAAPRVEYGASRLIDALKDVGIKADEVHASSARAQSASGVVRIIAGEKNDPAIQKLVKAGSVRLGKDADHEEGFQIESCPDNTLAIVGADDSGVLYGFLELADRVKKNKALPEHIHFADAPVFKLRGPCIGMQKTYILPGRHVYEYPYTKKLFPFFYDKTFWKNYLDFLAENRMNTLYIWNGHPFASLVKLKDYPFALEVSEKQYQENVDMYHYITREANKRGIWVVQMFYNIILSKPFAEHYHLPTQLKAPTPIAADYTRKSIAAFVKQYPHVGLLVCLGEALQNVPMQKEWLTNVILPGVKDGMKEAGLKKEPPVIIRAHATNARVVIPAGLKVYHNLYTMAKYNGESLTTWRPRGMWQKLQLDLSKLGSTNVVNVHILANLEPFRYGDTSFIRKCMLAARDRLHAEGLHLYPLSYWNWPYAPDKTTPKLLQYKRDWIWFEAWARYAWNPDRDPATDREFWIDQIAKHYGTREAAVPILDAYNDAGECAPRILRRFGITEGNRQTMSLGMTLDELVNPKKYHPYAELWKSQAPPGERLQTYVDREWNHEKHVGETPPQIIREILAYSRDAVDDIEAASPLVTENRAEYDRLKNDIYCIRAMSQNYAAKANAAMLVLRYRHSHDIHDMERAEKYLAKSLGYYKTLVTLTAGTYDYANSMQTSQRRIPVTGGIDGKPANYLWSQLLPMYEKELTDFKQKVANLKAGKAPAPVKQYHFKKAEVKVLSKGAETYQVNPGTKVFTDESWVLQSCNPALIGLTGIRFSNKQAQAGNYQPIEFETKEPVTVLIGYVQSKKPGWRQAPELETDALAGERGGDKMLIENGAKVDTLPPIDIYSLKYGKGRHKLDPRGDGSFVVLGVVADTSDKR